MMIHILRILLLACALAGCVRRRDLSGDFQSEDPNVRIAAVRVSGRDKIESAVPYLVDRLTDSEAEVRMFSIIALEKITGLTHDYRYYDAPAVRQEAVGRWRKWLTENNRVASGEPRPVEERKTE
ncbi:MAG: HEAT repeat domain-containing protein [bacterium]|nr:HEAT repeat domain-containing protein [bacterium]